MPANAVIDDDVEDDIPVALPDQFEDFLGVQRPGLVNRRQDAADPEPRVELGLDPLDRVMEQLHALHPEVLALERDEHFVGRHQGVDAEQTQGRWTVDHHEVVLFLPRRQLLLQKGLTSHLGDELDLRTGELDVRGHEVNAEVAVLDHMPEGDLRVEQQMIERQLDLVRLLEPHVDRQVTLGIEVDKEDALPELRERASQIHRGGRFANPAFLVGNGDDSAQTSARPLCWNVAAAI